MRYLNHSIAGAAAVLLALAAPAAESRAQSVPTPQPGRSYVGASVDYATARREIHMFEAAIHGAIGSTFTGPFGLVQKPKGVYLPGYGAMFDFLVNIHRAILSTPFGEFRDEKREITPEQKRKRVEELKEKLVRVLLERGEALRQLRRDDSVTIVAFFEDKSFPDEPNQNKTIVLRAYKRDLDELVRKENGSKELVRRMEIVEY